MNGATINEKEIFLFIILNRKEFDYKISFYID